jgi:hypothetical protein
MIYEQRLVRQAIAMHECNHIDNHTDNCIIIPAGQNLSVVSFDCQFRWPPSGSFA